MDAVTLSRRVNCNGCGRFMVEQWASVGPGGPTRCYHCDNCNRETVIDDVDAISDSPSENPSPATNLPPFVPYDPSVKEPWK